MILNILLIITALILAGVLIHNKVRESFVSIEVTNVNKDCEDEPEISEQKKNRGFAAL